MPQDLIHNDGNQDFYNFIKIEKFKEFTAITGFDTSPDVNILFPLIAQKTPLVELGAGYGRVVDSLLKLGYKGEIMAVERVKELVLHLQTLYAGNNQVKILEQDMKYLKLPQKAGAVLWLWSGVMEMSLSELMLTLSNLNAQMQRQAILILEMPYKTIKLVGEYENDKTIILKTDWGTLRAYFAEETEILDCAQSSGFIFQKSILYQTHKGLDRVLYIFEIQ